MTFILVMVQRPTGLNASAIFLRNFSSAVCAGLADDQSKSIRKETPSNPQPSQRFEVMAISHW